MLFLFNNLKLSFHINVFFNKKIECGVNVKENANNGTNFKFISIFIRLLYFF